MAVQAGVSSGATAPYFYEPELERMSRAELDELQLKRLRRTLNHACDNVPFYRRRFEATGLSPEMVRSLDHLRHVPFTTKSDLRDGYPFALFAVPRQKLRRLHASSGTTGKPTIVGYSAADLDTWGGLMARSLACAGARPGDIVHNAHGYGLFTGGLGVHYGAERLGCVVLPISGGGSERQVTLLSDLGADFICATPSYALNIAEVAEREGIDLRALPLRRGIFGGEPWSDALREELQRRLAIKACDIYGLSEIMGPGVACECDVAQAGLHGWEDHFLFEIIDPVTLEPRPRGESGELVITTLTKEALPMIRYRTRDITRLIDEPCPCGRTHVRLQKVSGRDDDMLIVRGANLFPSQIEAILARVDGVTLNYLIVLNREGALDSMLVEVEADRPQALDAERAARIAQEVRHRVKSVIGITCEVKVRQPGELPRSEGKAVRVRDLRPRI